MSFLLVTTSNALLLLEGTTGTGYRIDAGREHYYGIAQGLGTGHVGVRYRSNGWPAPKADDRGEVLVFDGRLRCTGEIAPDFPLRDIHRLRFDQGKLWVTCSYNDCVAVYDGRDWEVWYLRGEPDGEPRDRHHFNSIAGFGDQLCVVAHNGGARTGKASELLFFRLPDLSVAATVTPGSQAHNAWLHDTERMTCSSGEGLRLGA